MSCPVCYAEAGQAFLGSLGNTAVIRCAYCGAQYYAPGGCGDPDVYPDLDFSAKVRSRSEAGSFMEDGDADMRVLRSRAEGAVRYFNRGDPLRSMEDHVYGYAFSIVRDGRLSERDEYGGRSIVRSLSSSDTGFWKGLVTLNYNDSYPQGGYGEVLIEDVRQVRIDGDTLVISGYRDGRPRSYRYRIQDRVDVRPRTKKTGTTTGTTAKAAGRTSKAQKSGNRKPAKSTTKRKAAARKAPRMR